MYLIQDLALTRALLRSAARSMTSSSTKHAGRRRIECSCSHSDTRSASVLILCACCVHAVPYSPSLSNIYTDAQCLVQPYLGQDCCLERVVTPSKCMGYLHRPYHHTIPHRHRPPVRPLIRPRPQPRPSPHRHPPNRSPTASPPPPRAPAGPSPARPSRPPASTGPGSHR